MIPKIIDEQYCWARSPWGYFCRAMIATYNDGSRAVWGWSKYRGKYGYRTWGLDPKGWDIFPRTEQGLDDLTRGWKGYFSPGCQQRLTSKRKPGSIHIKSRKHLRSLILSQNHIGSKPDPTK